MIRLKLRNFALWLLDKTDKAELKNLRVDIDTTIGLEKYVPKTGKWYHIGTTVEWFVKRKHGKEIEKIGDVKLYVDGKLEGHWNL